MKNFTDKVAVISGGANGIGLDIGKCLAAEKCHVVIADIDQAACGAAASAISALGHGVEVVGMACDVTDKDQITALADKAWAHFGHVDILFNNAGVGAGLKPGDKTEDDDLRWVFEVNFFGNWNMCMEFLRRFKAQGSEAHICNTASENSIGWPMMTVMTSCNGTIEISTIHPIRHRRISSRGAAWPQSFPWILDPSTPLILLSAPNAILGLSFIYNSITRLKVPIAPPQFAGLIRSGFEC